MFKAAVLLAAFVLGSIPSGLLIARSASKVDPRLTGSGNIGATNLFRTGGPWVGLCTLGADAGKGALAVLLPGWACGMAGMSGGTAEFLSSLSALLVVAGHVFSPWLLGRGGKGVATAAGALAVLAPVPFLAGLLVFLAVLAVVRFVSAASAAGIAAFPAAAALLSSRTSVTGIGILLALLVVFRHRENWKRIAEGKEPRLGRYLHGEKHDDR